ncbi:MAG: hypothetical protein K5766_01730 [Alphaproteobacteria bacterium]|nr:hypothetical protein [Alphaproteobacteria bacterium]
MKQAIFLATLMYSSATVFGMQGEKRGLADQSSDSSSKVRLIEVSAPKYQQPLDKQLDSQTLEEMLGRANQDLEQARKDIDDFGWLYKDASKRVKSADKRAEIITKIFGDNQNLQGILEDKQKAEKDSAAFFALYRDAHDRKGSAKERVDMLTQQLTKLRVSEDSSQKSKEGMDIDKNAQKGSSSSETIKELKQTTRTAANNSPATDGKSPVVRLFEYCQGKNLSLELGYKKNEGKFGCFITIDRGNGNDGDVYDNGESYNTKTEAKNKTADYTLRKLMEKKGLPAPDNRGPVKKLNDYCLDKSTSIDVSDITYIYYKYADGTCNCKIQLKDEIFDLNLRCKTETEAKRIIAEYVYNMLVAKNGEASSSGTN